MRKFWVVKNEPKSNACLLSAIPNLFKPWTASDAAVDFWAQKVLKIAILFLIFLLADKDKYDISTIYLGMLKLAKAIH